MRKVLNDQREIDVRHYLEQWARWPTVLRGSSGGIGGNVIGRLMSGKRMRVCSLCHGEKRIPGKLVGVKHPVIVCPRCNAEGSEPATLKSDRRPTVTPCEHCRTYDEQSKRYRSTGELPDGRVCHMCQGGKRTIIELHVHPATISGTRYYGANTDPDPVSALLDRTVAGWAQTNLTYWLHAVVMMEYRNQYLGRLVAGGMTQGDKAIAMRVSRQWYVKNLSEAHKRIETLLSEYFNHTIDADVVKI